MQRKLGRKKDYREHLERNLLTSLVLYEKINTTKSKAKEIASSFDKLMTQAKKNDLNSKRRINSMLYDTKSAKKLFEVLVPRYNARNSGYTAMCILARRKGDNTEVCRLELMDKKVFVADKKVELGAKSIVAKKESK